MERFAVSHPGKMGDALYTLPSIRALAEEFNIEADFYTSKYCEPMRRLMLYQLEIKNFIVPTAYEILRDDIGIQPWEMPIDRSAYKNVIHMGFRKVPDKNLPEFIASSVGAYVGKLPRVYYNYPEIDLPDNPYICVAPRGNTTYKSLFYELIMDSPVDIAVIGGPEDNITTETYNSRGNKIHNLVGLDMLETVSWLSKSIGFVGLMSAMLVLANGFEVPKVAIHDGIHWDMRHIIKSDTNFYPINPLIGEIKELLKL